MGRPHTRFDPARGSLRSYLLTDAHGRAVDRLRAERARSRREERDARRAAAVDHDIEREVVDVTTADHVRRSMARLTDSERAAREALIGRYRVPQPRVAMAEIVRGHASAAMDVSDGLAGDLTKLCGVSGVSAVIDLVSVPLSGAAQDTGVARRCRTGDVDRWRR